MHSQDYPSSRTSCVRGGKNPNLYKKINGQVLTDTYQNVQFKFK